MKCPKCQTDNLSDSKFCRECATPLPDAKNDRIVRTETLEITPEESISGTIFAGRYKVIEELGRGGMGRVYRAYDIHLREEVALKIIKPEVASDKKALERFSNELKLARKIIHRNVARMYELMDYHGTRFLTMEYVAGEDLKSFIKRARRLDIGAAVSIAIQLCEGLVEAHRLGIVHRDLKPGNIMIDQNGSPKILDFGIARSVLESGITGEGRVVGTPEYISPEQIEGKTADAQSDLYALGVILFEMVCGTYPFEGDTARIIAQKIQGTKSPDPKSINPHVPDELAGVILKCLEKRRDRRYAYAAEVLAELQKIEDGLPTSERIMIKARSSLFAGFTRQIQKRKILGAAAGFVAVAFFVILVIHPWRSAPKVSVVAQKPTLAVLFFTNRTGDSSLDIWESNLCIKFIEAIRRLSSSSRLTVLSYNNIYSCLKKIALDDTDGYTADDLNKIASMSSASHVLMGSLMKLGQKLQIYCTLEEAASGVTVGSDRRDGNGLGDFDSMVNDLSKKVLENLGIPALGRTRATGTNSIVALQAYANARDLEVRAVLSQDQSERDALYSRLYETYQTAIRADRNFADAYWGLGDYFEHRFVVWHNRDDFKLMKENYELAYKLDPELAGANAGLGWSRYFEERLEEAYGYFKQAIMLEPDNPVINVNVGNFLRSIGLIDKGITYFTRAIESGDTSVGPISPTYRRARAYMEIGRLAEAADDVSKMMGKVPYDVGLLRLYARIQAMLNNPSKTEQVLADALKLDPTIPDLSYIMTYLYAARGDRKSALPILEKVEKEDIYHYSYFLSQNYARLGMNDKAIAVIRIGIKNGFAETYDYLYPYQVLASPFYDTLRTDPRFQEILKEQKELNNAQLEKFRGL